ncbi:MAG: tartrate-resistant acid phosphatase type 5 family protein [Methylacidiphilales bacterium]|nr:tartrate-resistant acid phosphatase type 5 family protein [Candidatus Methylacidiphilales bacterium]
MNTTRRHFVKTLFVAGQATLLGRVLGADAFAEAPADPASLNFLVFGDWGVNGDPGQAQVAAQMAHAAARTRAAFMLAAGDNFYEVGVKDVDDPQWQTSFERVYAAESLQIPCYAILGNHDYCGNCEAQIEYGKLHPRWIMPARYYTQTHRIDERGTLQFFCIDTSPFVKEYHATPVLPPKPTDHDKRAFEAGQNMLANVSGQDTARQTGWLKDALSKSKADWKIVVGHHPIYSGGVHGDQPELVEQILPILHQYGVHVYLCGHDHDLQHLQSDGIDFFCSGAGGAKLYPLHHTDETKYAVSTFGFMSMTLTRDAMKVDLIDNLGKAVYQTTVHQTV